MLPNVLRLDFPCNLRISSARGRGRGEGCYVKVMGR